MTYLPRLLLLALAGLVLAVPQGASAAPRSFVTGFSDEVYLDDAATRGAWFDRTRASLGGVARIEVRWANIAPRVRPAGFDPADPADPRYDFARLDAAVRDAASRQIGVILLINRAPAWAEGSDRDPAARPGTWRPDPGAIGSFARALAKRYSGVFGDPMSPGRPLPRVRRYEAWNEENFGVFLTPQYAETEQGRRLASPGHYRRMLNAVYEGVKAVSPDNLVALGGLNAFGDLGSGGTRIPPARFLRELLCLQGRSLRRLPCPDPARFDVLAHHPYSVGAPRRRARNPDDVSISDLGKLTRIVRAARRSGRALPRRSRGLWVTEISYDSSPPDPRGVPARRHARWLAEAFYLLWRQGADTVTWFQVRDADAGGDFASTLQSGVYLRDGRPKLAQRAFRFPFVAERRSARRVGVWGRAPISGVVRIQRRVGTRWATVRRVRTRGSNIFTGSLRLRRGALLRAVAGGEQSLAWRQR